MQLNKRVVLALASAIGLALAMLRLMNITVLTPAAPRTALAGTLKFFAAAPLVLAATAEATANPTVLAAAAD